MANFNYLDFFKTPSADDTKLFIKDVNNKVVWTLSPFKIKSSIIQNNNIRINFTNNDFILIDFNNVYESKIALTNLQTAINTLINKIPLNIDKDVELWTHNLDYVNGNLTINGSASINGDVYINGSASINGAMIINGDLLPATNSVYNLGSPDYQWHSLYVATSSVYIGGVKISTSEGSIVINNLNLGTPEEPYVLSAKNNVLYYNGLTFSPANTNINFTSLTTLVTSNPTNVILNNASSFTFKEHTLFPDNIHSLETFDNSQGFYLQTKIPAPVYSNSQLLIGAFGIENNYRITLYDDQLSPYYYLANNLDEIIRGNWTDEFIFAIYSDGYNINYEINGINVLSLTYSADNYGYSCQPLYTLHSDYRFENVLFYPTGKKGIIGDRYYATSTDLLAVPNNEQIIEINVEPNLAFSNGQWLLIKNDNIDIYSVDYEDIVLSFYGVVQSYDNNSGLLTMMALYPTGVGSTASFWYINLSGKEGPQGIKGDADRYTATSSIILTIPEPNTAINITVSTDLAYTSGQSVIIYGERPDFYSDPEYSEENRFFVSSIDNYDATTGELTLVCDYASGAGYTFSNWYINLTGKYYSSIYNPATYGVLTSDGSTGFNVNKNLTFDGNIFKIQATTQFQQTVEVLNTATASSIIIYDYLLGSIWYHNNLTSDYVAQFINVPTTDQRVIAISIIIEQRDTAFLPKIVSINGEFYTINWGSEIVGNPNQKDLVGLSFIFTDSTIIVLGQVSTYNTALSIPPTTTTDAHSIGFGNFSIDWTIETTGDSNILQSGIVYATHSNPTILDNFTNDGLLTTGSFTTTVSGINPYLSQTYYVKAYAINESGIGYGSEISFNTYVPCLIEGTLVTLKNGDTKKIEDITYEDDLLVWNFDEGKFDYAKPIWISKGSQTNKYNLIKFSDGTELKTVLAHLGHRIFNIESNKFTYPMTDDTPIGTHTFNDKGEKIQVIGKEEVRLTGNFFNIITEKHLNVFCNTILTSCRLNNLYTIKDMKFIKDNREINSINKFDDICKIYYDGYRLGEQNFNSELIQYIHDKHNIKK